MILAGLPIAATVEGDLYDVLGLPVDVGTDRLRIRYEAAVAAASRAEDWRRAQELSRAFDRLPRSVRLAVYPGRERNASRFADDQAGEDSPRQPRGRQAGKRAARRAERKMRARAAYQHTGMRKPFRVALYLIGALMIFAAVGGALQQFGILHRPVAPAPAEERYVPDNAPRQSVVVPAPVTGKIAPSLPVGGDGRIIVICQRVAFGSGSMMRVLPGTYVDCADGAVPQFAPGM